jgi:hypothetical protein
MVKKDFIGFLNFVWIFEGLHRYCRKVILTEHSEILQKGCPHLNVCPVERPERLQKIERNGCDLLANVSQNYQYSLTAALVVYPQGPIYCREILATCVKFSKGINNPLANQLFAGNFTESSQNYRENLPEVCPKYLSNTPEELTTELQFVILRSWNCKYFQKFLPY